MNDLVVCGSVFILLGCAIGASPWVSRWWTHRTLHRQEWPGDKWY